MDVIAHVQVPLALAIDVQQLSATLGSPQEINAVFEPS